MILSLLLLINILIQINSEIILNPIKITDDRCPFVLTSEDDYYYILTKKYIITLEKNTGNVINKKNHNIQLSSNFIGFDDNSNNNYLYDDDRYFYISYNESKLIKQTSFNLKLEYDLDKVINACKAPRINDFVIYGYKSNKLFFCIQSQNYCSSIEFNETLSEIISCKLILGMDYICAMLIDHQLTINFLRYNTYNNNPQQNSISLFSEDTISYIYDSIIDLGLYDTRDNNIKIFCEHQKDNTIKCNFYRITIENERYNCYLLGERLNFVNSKDWSEKDCYFSELNSEYLFCCGITNYIDCYRINITSYCIIKNFKIHILDENAYLIIRASNTFAVFFFKNDIEKVYEYYIYLPYCINKTYDIYKDSLNYNKSEEDSERLSNLFTIKTNKYYFELINPPDEYGYFTLNNTNISGRTLISSNDYILDFIWTNPELLRNIKITVNYILSVEDEEAYSKECQITINHLACYKSCETCSIGIYNSNETHHNCITCWDNYFPSPENNGNCYSIEEKKNNWYFDSTTSRFYFCHEECKTCSGPTNLNCTSCNNGTYLDNGKCTNECSSGDFEIKVQTAQDNYIICSECHQNCKTCSNFKKKDLGMNCATCKENQIKYNDNCYEIFISSTKHF